MLIDKVRDLGIYIDSRLKFAEHINLMVAKAHRRANQILRCLNFSPLAAKTSLVVTHLNFGYNNIGLMLENIFSSRVVTIRNQLPVEIFNVVTAAAFAASIRSCNLSHYLLGSK